MNLIILGPPGSGKGTQAKLLAQNLGLYLFETGLFARKLSKTNERIREIVDAGKLIPQEEMTMFVIDELNNNRSNMKNIIFDGFPRFVSQYEALSEFLKAKGDDIDGVINLKLDQETAIKRISSRRMCVRCGKTYNLITNPPPQEGICDCGGDLVQRKDDNPESVKVRFDYYQKYTKELTDYLRDKDLLIEVDADQPIETIQQEILQKLK